MKQQKCIWCGKETTTPSHTSRKKKYCNNSCQLAYEKDKGLRFKLPPISKEDLWKLYIDDKLSCKKIADKLGVSIKQVSRFLKRYEIPAREFSTKGLATRKDAILSNETKAKIAKAHTGKTLSVEHKKSIRENAKYGESNKSWKGGVTPINKKIRASVEYKLWRLEIFERDKYTCVLCAKRGGDLEADHIKPFANFPELRFEKSNGRTLCKSCHRKTDTFGYKARKNY